MLILIEQQNIEREREKVTLNLDKTLSGGGTENKDQRNKWTVDKTTTTEAGTRHAGTMEKREGKRKSSLRWASKVKSMAVVVVICIETTY